jgi:integrase
MKQADIPGLETVAKAFAKRQSVKSRKAAPPAAGVVDAHERRKRDFLTQTELDQLIAAARQGRFGQRDAAMILIAYRHGLRATELISLRRDDIDLEEGRVWIERLKRGLSTSQPLAGDEVRILRAYFRERTDRLPWAFASSQRTQFSRQAWHYLVREAGERAGLGPVHPHMLRHSCGHVLADAGTDTRLLQDWLGHRDIRHTALYSRTSSKRFEGLWKR